MHKVVTADCTDCLGVQPKNLAFEYPKMTRMKAVALIEANNALEISCVAK